MLRHKNLPQKNLAIGSFDYSKMSKPSELPLYICHCLGSMPPNSVEASPRTIANHLVLRKSTCNAANNPRCVVLAADSSLLEGLLMWEEMTPTSQWTIEPIWSHLIFSLGPAHSVLVKIDSCVRFLSGKLNKEPLDQGYLLVLCQAVSCYHALEITLSIVQ